MNRFAATLAQRQESVLHRHTTTSLSRKLEARLERCRTAFMGNLLLWFKLVIACDGCGSPAYLSPYEFVVVRGETAEATRVGRWVSAAFRLRHLHA